MTAEAWLSACVERLRQALGFLEDMMKFTKMHGLGNDYLYVFSQTEPRNPQNLAVKLSDRHFGAGSDGMIWILPSAKADYKMRILIKAIRIKHTLQSKHSLESKCLRLLLKRER